MVLLQESSSLRNMPVVIMSSENITSRITRCLEEGAEIFFLKPVRLSDLSKLRPHMLKTKLKDHNQKQEEKTAFQSPKQQKVQQQEQQQQQQSNNNKRKAIDEGLSHLRRTT
ncbi:two-component response regulator ARR9-like [Hibiscus syriacus]|uniref:two-component response regulator ARR9-like n=1 Tax=Hibiscus syriacus TaxID=106335 RepID=UPI001922FF9C|nr:two-component response regulator ARR9-like [Hibiscus syriacus]